MDTNTKDTIPDNLKNPLDTCLALVVDYGIEEEIDFEALEARQNPNPAELKK